MKEFRYVIYTQIFAIIFLIGIVLGSFTQNTKIIYVSPLKTASFEFVAENAMIYHGTYGASFNDDSKCWYFIDKQGRPCKLFMEKHVHN